MIFEGRVWKFPDNVDTDIIIPAKYLNIVDPKELSKYCMEGIDPEFSKKVKKGDIIVAGKNFGCGSSREHAPACIKALGISVVLAESFARIFFRNAINIGLPIMKVERISEFTSNGDILIVNFDKGEVINLTKNIKLKGYTFPDFMKEIIKEGGLLNWIKQKLK